MSRRKHLSVAVVGAGWAGLTAAIDAVDQGHRVSVFDMAPQPGGRARSAPTKGAAPEHGVDNGQHIMVGAYRDTFALMTRVGVDLDRVLMRLPLTLVDPKGRGLRLPPGRPMLSFVRGVAAALHWPWAARFALLRTAARWHRHGFTAASDATVASLLEGVPDIVVREFFDPLCVAALNTPTATASGKVFLRVLRDALLSGPGSSDLVLPRAPLATVFPDPACTYLANHGAQLHLRSRVQAVHRTAGAWCVESDAAGGQAFDAVVLACSANEAARLTETLNASWSKRAKAVRYQSIVTVYASHTDASLPEPMLALASDAERPAQFVFDHGRMGMQSGRLAFVVSGANAWLDRGLDAVVQATLAQARDLDQPWTSGLTVDHAVAEKRATFACTCDLDRPPISIAAGLWAAADYVEGPYPSTLEGAVRAGRRVAASLAA